jgi:adenylate cyclase
MTQEKFKRKLTTILSADVAGYSRLMADDETATVKTLEKYKAIMSELICQQRGRVVDSAGDNLLAEFGSVVDAVECAMAAQKELKAHNDELPENRRMKFRIGINLGDVIEEGPHIYGDGVNTAARLESLADPGGICLSRMAFDQVKTKLPFSYAFLGEHAVKNNANPVKVYKVLMKSRVTKEKVAGRRLQGAAWRIAVISLVAAMVVASDVGLWQLFLRRAGPTVEKANPKQMALPLPEMPSIAVLPFKNLSEDSKQELLSDGITDNIVNALSKIPQLFVIARNSTSLYKEKTVTVKQVSEEFGVRYVLEGSLQSSANRVRITAQLVDALTGNQLWTERFEGEATDVFDLQDEITLKVLNAVDVKLASSEAIIPKDWQYFSGKQSLACYLKGLEVLSHIQRSTIPDTHSARQKAEEGLVLCPEIPNFYYYMATVHTQDYLLGSSKSPRESIEKAMELFQKVLDMDDGHVCAHANLSWVYTIRREYDKAIAEGKRAVTLNPGSAFALFRYAETLTYAGRPEEAVPIFEKAIRLNPLAPAGYYIAQGIALRETGRLAAAAASFKKAIERSPNCFKAHAYLAAVSSLMGRDDEAQAEAAEVLRLNPNFSLEEYASRSMYKDPAVLDKHITAMRKAGLPSALGLKTVAAAPLRRPENRPVVDKMGNAIRKVSLPAKSRAIGAPVSTEEIILKLRETNRRINNLPSEFFKNSSMKTALSNRLNAAMRDINDERYPEALRMLDNDVLPRIDGCAQSHKPDKNDWVMTCTAQENAYFLLTESIDMLEELM